MSGIYTANNIIAETNVNVTGTAQLKAGISVTLKPGFRAAEGCSLIVLIDNTLVVEPEKYYYVKDHLGSTRVTVDEEGKIASYYDYDPWGMLLEDRNNNFGVSNEKYKFTGKERDDETNYDYFGARYYDSRIGRWLGVDPWDDIFPASSPFSYCVNNSIRYIDPYGYGHYEPDPRDPSKQIWNPYDEEVLIVGDRVTSDLGINFILSYEKYRANIYEDAGGHATIGYGHLIHLGVITEEDRSNYKNGWTKKEATKQFAKDLSDKEEDVRNLFKNEILTQNEFDALVSITYNAGKTNISNSLLYKTLINRNYTNTEIRSLWMKTLIRSSGKVLQGLINRRAKESNIFIEGVYEMHK